MFSRLPSAIRRLPSAASLSLLVGLAWTLAGCPITLPRSPLADIASQGPEDLIPLDLWNQADERAADSSSPDMADLWWGETALEDSNAEWDVADTEGETGDVNVDIEPPPTWECTVPLDALGTTPVESSFLVRGQPAAFLEPTDLYIYAAVCGLEYANAGPQGVHLLEVPKFTGLYAEAKCSAPCYIALFREGCTYANIESCQWLGGNEVSFGQDLLPGLYLLMVEFLWDGLTPLEELTYDLHVSLQKDYGQTPCQPRETLQFSSFEGLVCENKEGLYQQSVEGQLSPDDQDDFHLFCGASGPVDYIGGMADRVEAFTYNVSDGEPAQVKVELDVAPGEQQLAGVLLGLTGSPCGAAESTITCDAGTAALETDWVWVFPGETLFAVVDTLGSDAWSFVSPLSYSLRWTVKRPCNPAR